MVSLSLGITTNEFDEVFADQKVAVTFSVATKSIDPIYGQANTTTYADQSKNWIFFKHYSENALKQWGIADVGDAYVIMETEDSMAFSDRITYDGEIFEYTPDCKKVLRYANGTALYRFYTLKRVG